MDTTITGRIGYTCNIFNSDGDHDKDFLYLCYASNLIISGGGYSKLAQTVHYLLKK